MSFENEKIKRIIGLIAFIVGIVLITSSTLIPLPETIVIIFGALLVAYGVLNLMGLIHEIIADKKKIIGIIAFILGIELIISSSWIPFPNIVVNIFGALLIAYGILNLKSIID